MNVEFRMSQNHFQNSFSLLYSDLNYYCLKIYRTELVNCDSDVDFSVKVFCLRRAFKVNLYS